MELAGDQKLRTLLHASLAGEIALFAAFFPTEEDDIAVLNEGTSLGDARGRKIYEVFKLMNPPGEDDVELCTDLHFNEDDTDLSLTPGTVVEREVEHSVFGKITMKLVKLTTEDADFLLGVLPDELLDQTAVYEDVDR